ncbi:MAG: VWA domain-containing protein [Chlorogloea purpurea SAG 13.99]|nr:VWA domain-containing protein [Chlorogloea purpurea SAG 13.99]
MSLLIVCAQTAAVMAQVKELNIESLKTNEDRVILRVKAKGEENRPVVTLDKKDFSVKVIDPLTKKPVSDKITFNWKSPTATIPPPAWIVVLVDFSGSMNQPDGSGSAQRKLDGALGAIKKFVAGAAERGGNTQIAIVPFGKASGNCQVDYPVNSQTLTKFFPPQDPQLNAYLDALGKQTPCAGTNLYDAVNAAIDFLANPEDTRFHPAEESGAEKPRLSIILVSDGFDTTDTDRSTVIDRLKEHPEIILHTLGYGLTPRQLQRKYKLARIPTQKDLYWDNPVPKGKVPADEFVDKAGLAEIAAVNGGIAEFSGDSEGIAKELKLFLTALLGEYEISYQQPASERGKTYEVTVASQNVKSAPEEYRITVFGRALSFPTRLAMFVASLAALGIGGVIPYRMWANRLEEEARGN